VVGSLASAGRLAGSMSEVAEWYDRTADTGETVEITDLLDWTTGEPTESERRES
jgi:hypothetical protein